MAVTANQNLSVISTNANDNTAVIRYTVTCTTSGESYNNYEQTGTFNIDGTNYTNTYTLPRNSTTTVFNKDVTIGNASDRTIEASYSFPTTPSGGTKTGNTSVKIDNIPRYAEITELSIKSRTCNSITISYSVSRSANIFCSLDNGVNWLNGGQPFHRNSTGGEITIYYEDVDGTTRLQPNKSYTINLLSRATISNLNRQEQISVTTYDIGKISSANNFNHGDSTTVNITNPSGSSLSLAMKIGNTQIQSKSVSAGNNTISFNDTELDNIYKLYGRENTLTANFILTTAGTYTNSKTCTITLNGNQKTVKANINGSWKRGKVWVKVNGTWKKAVIWTNVNGTWRRCI